MVEIIWHRKINKRGGSLSVTIPPKLAETMSISSSDKIIIKLKEIDNKNVIIISKEAKK